MIREKAQAMVLASFIADSLALGAHWIYDPVKIKQDIGRMESFKKPLPGSYHSTKDKGAFTHYGDQMMVLLESIASQGTFDPKDFSSRWQTLFADYHGYYDKATKETLNNIKSGKQPEEAGSASGDLAGASRIAPLVYRYRDDLETLVQAATLQTSMTHNNPRVVALSEFLARTLWQTLHGAAPTDAMREVASQPFAEGPIAQAVERSLTSINDDTVSAITVFGQSCDASGAFPSVVHLIARYEHDLKTALVENVMAGGDQAGRGMAVGAVLGAYLGMEAIPQQWLDELLAKPGIEEALRKLP